jgi:aspartyl-tRNA(Asn)/glutamyl-tRNA(Gln) amidotransferase subunit B
MTYSVSVGLEVHVQLRTRSKMFCGCATSFGAEPNMHVCPVCLGYPGAMPVMNREAVRLTVLSGLMLGCEVNPYSKFDRKSYFYPDMPKNYQISQYDKPLCLGGAVEIPVPGGTRRIALTRIHLEEDVGKSTHHSTCSGVDFNRAGVPLMEIVTEPEMTSVEETVAFLQTLKQILLYTGVSDCNMEEGNLRCDVNVSVRPAGQKQLGTKAELKNMNSFKAVHAALEFEVRRQIDLLQGGGRVIQETRRWDPDAGVTLPMRSKEDAHDYRYFPEPDLLPVVLDRAQIEAWRSELPELPSRRRTRLVAEYGIPEYDAGVLAADREVADFFEAAARACGNGKAVSNWVMTDVLRLLTETGKTLGASALTPEALSELIGLVSAGTINMPTAKELLPELFAQGGRPAALVTARGLGQVSDGDEVVRLVDQAIAANPKTVADWKAGKQAAAAFFVGQVMKLSRGKADPKLAGRLVAERLAAQ